MTLDKIKEVLLIEPLFEMDGVRIFWEKDSYGNLTGELVSYPESAVDPITGICDQTRKIIWPKELLVNQEPANDKTNF